jgi:hypothetical protein
MELMSFDRIGPDPGLRDALTVRAKGYGKYEVVAVPPTFALSPQNAEVLLRIDGFKDALESESRISTERKEFIMERIEYWREWASSGGSGIIASYFRE